MINSILHHLGIGITDPNNFIKFFDELFVDLLKMEKEDTWESVAGYKGRGTRFYIYKVQKGTPPGSLQHIALTAKNKGEVDKIYKWALRNNINIVDEPKRHPEYGGDYYAFFFEGPDKIKFEIVYLTESDKAQPL